MGSKSIDRFGRPCGVISLQSLERTEERTLDECKEYIVACMEIVRRRIAELRRRYHQGGGQGSSGKANLQDQSEGPLQMVIAFDLISSSMSNLELELLPFLLDLLKNHFPGMVGAVFVLHYGWVHSGMWALAKRILPGQALAKIFFPSEKELCNEHFSSDRVASPFGGDWAVEIEADTNDCVKRLGRPLVSIRGGSAPGSPTGSPSQTRGPRSRAMSRNGSYESMADYFSASNTRSHSPRQSQPVTPRGETSSSSALAHTGAPGMQMTASVTRKLKNLQLTSGGSGTDGMYRGGRQRSDSAATDASTSSSQTARQAMDDGDETITTKAQLPRPGSLRDFRLDTGLATASSLEYPDEDGSEENSDGDSSKDRKAGDFEAPVGPSWTAGVAGSAMSRLPFLRRWQSQGAQNGATTGDEQVEMEPDPAQGSSSPQLQVADVGSEPPISESDIGSNASQTSPSGARFASLRRSRKYDRMPGAVSPYNASNPFWGYPAYIESAGVSRAGSTTNLAGMTNATRGKVRLGPRSYSVDGSSGRHRQMTVRRRWRDLIRTLAYLFVLRILAFNRQLRWKMGRVVALATSPVRHPVKRVLHGVNRLRSSDAANSSADRVENGVGRPGEDRTDGADDYENEDEDEDRKWHEATERHRQLRAALRQHRGDGGELRSSPLPSSQGLEWSDAVIVSAFILLVSLWLASRRRRQQGRAGLRQSIKSLLVSAADRGVGRISG